MRPPGPYARFGPALRQVQRQTQTLAMTPQLRQAIQLLQLSNLELNAWLEGALETNPLLTRDEGGGENAPDREDEPRADTADPAPLDFGGAEFAPAESLGETAAANLWDGDGDAGAGESPIEEVPHVQHRLGGSQLPRDQAPQQNHRPDHSCRGRPGHPPPLRSLDEPPHQAQDAGNGKSAPDGIEGRPVRIS